MYPPLVVSYGGGVNSTALLVGLEDRGIKPDLVLFADTGGEKPETYAYLDVMDRWLDDHGFPPLVRVRNDGMYESLEDNCLKKKMLPSLAYGFKSCSDKYKRRPQDKYVAAWHPARLTWAHGKKVNKAIGIDAGERRRAGITEDERYIYWYPLVEWGWYREECLAEIADAGLPMPPRSSCFFCPASTKREIFCLAQEHPDLMARAVAMEDNARDNLQSTKGLGRRFAWGELLEKDRLSLPLFRDQDDPPTEIACMCFDGEE
jgi:hypothetical protein